MKNGIEISRTRSVRATEATYDIQFGNVRRPTHWNTSWDYAKFETVGHQWADLSERGYGVSLLNDGKYGYDIRDRVIRLTLIKSALVPDPQADQGHHAFTYALYPHEGDWFEGGTVEEAWALNQPLTWEEGELSLPMGRGAFSLLSPTAGHIAIDAVKKAEDGEAAVVRLHEFAGQRGRAELRSDLPIVRWQECNLLEEPEGAVQEGGGPTFDLRPYEIKTFLIWFGSARGAGGSVLPQGR